MSEEKDISENDNDLDADRVPDASNDISQSDIPQPAIEKMEVHHHPDLKHEKKNFREYFLEFIMIFLAVTMGFLAESLRENINDRHKEEEYMHSLMADLALDKKSVEKHAKDLTTAITMLDSLIVMLDNPAVISASSGKLYYLARLGPRTQNLSVNQRTFEQLRNSGNFRVIKKIAVSDKIMAYYEKLAQINLLQNLYNNEFDDYKKVAARIFEPAVFKRMETTDGGVSRITDNPSLQTLNPELLKELAVFAVYMNGSRTGLLALENELKNDCTDLSAFLEKEYHLEKE